MMKRFFLLICFLSFFYVNAFADVCGNSYTFFYNEVIYILKFTSSNPELPCTSGSAVLYWQTQTSNFSFTVNSQKLINIPSIGKFFLSNDQLYMLDSTSIIFDQL